MADTFMSDEQENLDERDKYRIFISERLQKITEALYRVTDLFPEEEPLKWILRKTGLGIFNQVSFFASKDAFHQNTQSLKAAFSDISHILSLLELASAGSFITQINFEVLRREYSALRNFIEDKKTKLFPVNLNIASNNFLLEEKKISQGHSNGHNNASISHSNGHDNHKISRELREPQEQKQGVGNFIENSGEKPEEIQKKETLLPISQAKTSRRETILDFLKTNGWASVGQISALFSGNVSEKTIQRDLLGMTEKGVLDKEGDKRWRRYSVKN